jgi:hypothetical protein
MYDDVEVAAARIVIFYLKIPKPCDNNLSDLCSARGDCSIMKKFPYYGKSSIIIIN